MKKLLLLASLLLFAAPAAAQEFRPSEPGPKDRCAVCGMFVAKYPNFVAQLSLADGSAVFFDGVKDMARYYRNPAKFGAKDAAVRAVFVKDYYTLEPMDGKAAYYVLGSDVMGPMGNELIPFRTAEAADGFLKDHKGQRVLRFEEIDDAVLTGLN
jgi:nitrous oxide reductase accessory protein NosL